MVFTGAPVAGEKERPDIAKRNNHESFHSRKSNAVSVPDQS